jgi:hypothetical protein
MMLQSISSGNQGRVGLQFQRPTRSALTQSDVLPTTVSSVDDGGRFSLSTIHRKVNALRTWGDNWDGHGSQRPSIDGINAVMAALPKLFEITVNSEIGWCDPQVSASERGDIVLEWWSGPHKLTLYFGATCIDYVQVWGPNIETEMCDGTLRTRNEFEVLWRWLYL